MPSSELGASIGRFGLIAAGGYAFGPVGAAAGAVLGSFLFASSGPKIEGPRLGDLEVSSSAYGGVIPIGFGVQKVAGAMIWATDIVEVKNTRTGRRRPVRRRPEDRRVPVLRQLRGRLRRGAGRRGPADLGRRQADRGSARGRQRLRQPPQVQFSDPPGHRGPGAGPADPQAHRGQARRQRHTGVPGPGQHRVRGSAARRVRQPHPADHRRDHLGGGAAGGGQGHDVPVGDRLLHQRCGARFGAGVSLLQDVAGRDRAHSHLRHGRGPAGACGRARHRPDRREGDRQPGRPLRHPRHHRAVLPQDRRRHAPGGRQRELFEPGRAGDRQRLHADRPDRLRAGPGVPFRPGADLLRRRPLRVLARAERLQPPGRRGRRPQRVRRVRGLVRGLPLDRAGQSDRHGQHPARPDGAAVHGQPDQRLSRDREAQPDHARRQRARRLFDDLHPALLRRAERSAAVHQRPRRRAPPGLVQRRKVASSGTSRSPAICPTRHGSPTARSAW